MKKVEMSNTINTMMKVIKGANISDIDVIVYGESVDDDVDSVFVGNAESLMGFPVEDILAIGGLPGVLNDPLAVAEVTADGYVYGDVVFITTSLYVNHSGHLAANIVVHVDMYMKEAIFNEDH